MEQKTSIPRMISTTVIFVISAIIGFISLIPVVFPALLVYSINPIKDSPINPWELGVLAMPFIAINIGLFIFIKGYHNGEIPQKIQNGIRFLLEFEISRNTALIVLAFILAVYFTSSIGEITQEESFGDFRNVQQDIDKWEVDDIWSKFKLHTKIILLKSSIEIFDNIRVVPLLASMAMLIVTYFFTREISQKRFAGIVSVIIVTQSYTFLRYDTSATYDNFWILFYLLSLYSLYKFWPLSPILFLISIFSKPFTIAFLPMSIFFIYRFNLNNKKKIILMASHLAILSVGVLAVVLLDMELVGRADEAAPVGQLIKPFSNLEFWQGFTAASFILRFDYLVLIFVLPVIIGLYFLAKRGNLEGQVIMVLISGILFLGPILSGFSYFTVQPYRIIPLILFFAVGVGLLLVNSNKNRIAKVESL